MSKLLYNFFNLDMSYVIIERVAYGTAVTLSGVKSQKTCRNECTGSLETRVGETAEWKERRESCQ
jgi:hypothetical protein